MANATRTSCTGFESAWTQARNHVLKEMEKPGSLWYRYMDHTSFEPFKGGPKMEQTAMLIMKGKLSNTQAFRIVQTLLKHVFPPDWIVDWLFEYEKLHSQARGEDVAQMLLSWYKGHPSFNKKSDFHMAYTNDDRLIFGSDHPGLASSHMYVCHIGPDRKPFWKLEHYVNPRQHAMNEDGGLAGYCQRNWNLGDDIYDAIERLKKHRYPNKDGSKRKHQGFNFVVPGLGRPMSQQPKEVVDFEVLKRAKLYYIEDRFAAEARKTMQVYWSKRK